jgi:MFS family permease
MIMWSAMTALLGLTQNYWQFLLARIGVGIGEAGGTPPSTSIIADNFPRGRRAFALTVYAMGLPLGAWMGSDMAGWVVEHFHSWRAAFIALGIPGVRGRFEALTEDSAPPATFVETCRFLWTQRSAWHINAAGTVICLWGWGLLWWTQTYLERKFGLSTGDAGHRLGTIYFWAGSLATVATGLVLAMPQMQDPKRVARMLGVLVALSTIPSFIAYWTSSLELATAMLWLVVPTAYLYVGPTMALLLNFLPPTMRAQGMAISLLTANLANLIIAPTLVGWISDMLAGPLGGNAESLRYALLGLSLTGFWAAYHYLTSVRTYGPDDERVRLASIKPAQT